MIDPRGVGTSRREWLGAASAAIVSACTVGRVARASAQMGKVVVGAHPWVYAAPLPKYDVTPILDQVFADMAHAGMDGIELMHNVLIGHDDCVPRIRALVEKHRLPVIGTSYGAAMWDRSQHATILAESREMLGRLEKLGGKTLGTSVGPAPKSKTPEQLDAQAEVVKALMTMAADHGVVLNLHNHTYEVVDGMHDLRGTLERVPGVKLGPDLNWLVRGGVDPPAFIREFGNRVVFMHLRDQKADGKWSEAMGEGVMDYPAVRKALEDVHFSGHAMIELAHERGFAPTRPLRESLAMSRAFVKRTLGF